MSSPADSRTQPHIIQILTTEHYNLQTSRSSTIAEASGRSNLFLSTVSSTLVALAFVGQISRLGTAFFVFALVLFPSLFFLGLVTFERVVQVSIEDVLYARGINRIRHFYVEVAPEIEKYFVLGHYDDEASVYGKMNTTATWVQMFLTTPGMIAFLDSVIAAVFFGLLVDRLFQGQVMWVDLSVGFAAFLLVMAALLRYQWTTWARTQRGNPVLFPSPKQP